MAVSNAIYNDDDIIHSNSISMETKSSPPVVMVPRLMPTGPSENLYESDEPDNNKYYEVTIASQNNHNISAGPQGQNVTPDQDYSMATDPNYNLATDSDTITMAQPACTGYDTALPVKHDKPVVLYSVVNNPKPGVDSDDMVMYDNSTYQSSISNHVTAEG